MVGINRQSKYVEAGFRNQVLYETYLDLEGEIEVGERVSCQASPGGSFSGVDDDGGVTITLLPFGIVYSFGAPGHGKGPYNGIGGRWKNKIDQCMSTVGTGLLECTVSGFIQGVDDVHSALE